MNKKAEQSIQQVLVLGDLAFETLLIPEASTQKHGTRMLSDYVGATIIRDIIVGALDQADESKGIAAAKVYPSVHLQPDCPRDQLRELVAVFGKFPRKSEGNKSDTVWRVGSTHRARPDTKQFDEYDSHLGKNIEACATPSVVVIYEDDEQFRNAFKRLAENRRHSRKDPKPTLIIGLSEKAMPTSIETAKQVFDTGTTIAIVKADGLRGRDLDIASHASIEQTVQGLSKCLTTEPLKQILGLCSHLIVLLEHSGILSITKNPRQGAVHFSPNFDRPAQTHPAAYGRVPGRMAIVLGSIARFVCQAGIQADLSSLDLAPALRLSVAAYDRMFEKGYDERNPFETAKNVLSRAEREELRDILASKSESKRRAFLISSLNFPANPVSLRNWSRLDSLKKLDIGKEIVLNGVETASRMPPPENKPSLDNNWWPSAEIICPFMQLGRLQTFDKDEVERLANLAKLIGKYHDDPKWLTPLSIAVFGPPGAGKSFAVKQLMKTVNPAIKDSSVLTFNLAQFNSLELLTEAFHQVQDQVLFSEDVPLVIFDEFDSVFQGSELGWLKFFLAPMEDGIFRGQTSNYKVGRALFLFAGGTACTFDEFAGRGPVPKGSTAKAARTKREAIRKAAKAPDFVSRLMAHLDVLGINRPEGSPLEKPGELIRRRVRRATLLRSLLEEFAKPIIGANEPARISGPVIDAFLNDQVTYRNQARSMKAIVRGSLLIGNQFLRASLPPRSMIELHAEGWLFGE